MHFKEPHSLLLSQKLYVVPMTTRKQENTWRQIPLLNYLLLFESALTLHLAHARSNAHTHARAVQPNAHTLILYTHWAHATNDFTFPFQPPLYVWGEKAQLRVTLMCETVKVNYHLIFILFTCDSWSLWVMLDWTYAEEPILVTSCRVFALKLHQKSAKTTLSGPINSSNRGWCNAIMDVLNVWDGYPCWSMCVLVSGHSWTFDPLWGLNIKPKRKHGSKGQVMTVPAGLFHLSLRDGWAADDQSASLQLTVVHFYLSTQVLADPRKAQVSTVDRHHN